MEGNEQLAVIIPMPKQVGAGILPEQLNGSTPCVSFSVSGVLDHMTGKARRARGRIDRVNSH
jgi:hypothetical protein